MVISSVELYNTSIRIEGRSEGCESTYRYILLECKKEINYRGQAMIVPCFGVSIVREDLKDGKVYSVKKDSIECMTTYKYKASQLLKKLYDNLVSPIHLIDIAGEYADEWVEDFEAELTSTAVQ